MSERKVLTKYYPPDFDPSKLTRQRTKSTGPKQITVRLMAPFSMKCTTCGEYIYKGRKFNARKETAEEKYLGINIFRFYIRCTRCSAEITFKTDPKNMDYVCEKGARRNFEAWRDGKVEETDEERLNRLQEEEEAKDAMEELELKTHDAKQEMQIADALDEIRSRNARNEMAARAREGEIVTVENVVDNERERQEREDEEAAKRAFARALNPVIEEEEFEVVAIADELPAQSAIIPAAPAIEEQMAAPAPFKRVTKKKKDFGAALGIKKKPALV